MYLAVADILLKMYLQVVSFGWFIMSKSRISAKAFWTLVANEIKRTFVLNDNIENLLQSAQLLSQISLGVCRLLDSIRHPISSSLP